MQSIEEYIDAKNKLQLDFFGGWKECDVELLSRYQYADAEHGVGELTDWLGIRTEIALHAWVERPQAGFIHILGLPIPSDQIHAEAIEYIALIVALERAQANGMARFSAMELGASYGPWVTAAGVLGCRFGFGDIELTAVEASKFATPKIVEHAERNGLIGRPNVKVDAINAAVNVNDEAVFFPRVDVAADNGAQVSHEIGSVDYRGVALEYDRVEGRSLATLCRDKQRIDFLHLDLQGAEEALLQDVDFIDTLTSKVATFFLATQSRLIEGLALKLLTSRGWQLVRERPTTYQQNNRTEDVNGWTLRDGGQLWLNPRFGDKHLNL